MKAIGAGAPSLCSFVWTMNMMMDGGSIVDMMILMFLFGLLLIVLFLLIVVAAMKSPWSSKMPFLMNDRENALEILKTAASKARSIGGDDFEAIRRDIER